MTILITTNRKALKQTGLTLQRVDSEPKAGNINYKMLLDIQKSKIVIAELTYANNGVYWESGYAEALKKPVVYLCSRTWLDADPKSNRVHFDIRNENTIFWTPETMEGKMEDLKALIRYTLPDVLQEDPKEELEEEI